MKCAPNTMMVIPAAIKNQSWYCSSARPSAENAIPNSRNTVDSPSTKNSAEVTTRRRAAEAASISRTDTPPM